MESPEVPLESSQEAITHHAAHAGGEHWIMGVAPHAPAVHRVLAVVAPERPVPLRLRHHHIRQNADLHGAVLHHAQPVLRLHRGSAQLGFLAGGQQSVGPDRGVLALHQPVRRRNHPGVRTAAGVRGGRSITNFEGPTRMDPSADIIHLRQAIEVAAKARAKGNHPFGAVLVDAEASGGGGENTFLTDGGPGHAETNLAPLRRAHLCAGLSGEAALCTPPWNRAACARAPFIGPTSARWCTA